MAEQMGFGFGEEQPPTDRLFYALFPDAGTAEVIAGHAARLKAELGLKGRPLQTDRFHVTLFHVGDYAGLPRDVVAEALQAADEVKSAPFQVEFDRAASFMGRPSNLPFVLQGGEGVAEVKTFRQALGAAMLMKPRLTKVARSQYVPHVTLLYDDKAVPERPILPVRWTAREFVLMHSLIGQTRHIPLGRWALEG